MNSESIVARAVPLVASGALGAAVAAWFLRRGGKAAATAAAPAAAGKQEELSTTSSAQSPQIYETQKAVAEYLLFHFGADADILPYPGSVAPVNALNFASRTAKLCIDWAQRQGLRLDAALDVGCAVGRTSFDLSSAFSRVVGLDFSHAFIAAANSMKAEGRAKYTCTVEGEVTATHDAVVPAGVHAERITFRQGDACALPTAEELGGRFTVIHGANLLCRLPDPLRFLERLPSLLLPGGLVVFISPYSWLPQYTARDKWLGGRAGGCSSFEGLSAAMARLGFSLLHEEQVPFLIREHARKFQWGCSHATIWRLNA